MRHLTIAITLLLCASTAFGRMGMMVVGGGVAVSGGPELLRINGGGTANWTTYDSAAYPAHNTYLGDNDDSTYVYTSGATVGERHALTDTANSASITSIDFCVKARSSNGTAQMRIYAYRTNWSYSSYFAPANGVWTEYCHNTTVDPATGSAWTQSGFNGADIGANSDGTAGDGQVDISEMYVKIYR